MPRSLLPLALAMCAHACTDDEEREPVDTPPMVDDEHGSVSTSIETPLEDYDPCAHLPADPPCSLICDREALADYVPVASCAVFLCTLSDGIQVTVHACHPPP
jgi:hypothetical protein